MRLVVHHPRHHSRGELVRFRGSSEGSGRQRDDGECEWWARGTHLADALFRNSRVASRADAHPQRAGGGVRGARRATDDVRGRGETLRQRVAVRRPHVVHRCAGRAEADARSAQGDQGVRGADPRAAHAKAHPRRAAPPEVRRRRDWAARRRDHRAGLQDVPGEGRSPRGHGRGAPAGARLPRRAGEGAVEARRALGHRRVPAAAAGQLRHRRQPVARRDGRPLDPPARAARRRALRADCQDEGQVDVARGVARRHARQRARRADAVGDFGGDDGYADHAAASNFEQRGGDARAGRRQARGGGDGERRHRMGADQAWPAGLDGEGGARLLVVHGRCQGRAWAGGLEERRSDCLRQGRRNALAQRQGHSALEGLGARSAR